MLFYDWPKLCDAAEGKVVNTVRIFRMIVQKQVPKNRFDKIYKYSQIDFTGESFMVHPDVLLYHSFKYKYREVAQYISLCALRSSADFISTQDPSLDMVLMPGLSPEKIIENNRLLEIDEDRVYFRYEEVNPKEIH